MCLPTITITTFLQCILYEINKKSKERDTHIKWSDFVVTCWKKKIIAFETSITKSRLDFFFFLFITSWSCIGVG